MLVAYELGKTLKEIYELMDQDEVGWWLAFFNVKSEREEARIKASRRRGNAGKLPNVT